MINNPVDIDYRKIISERIKEIRTDNGMTMKEMGKLMNVTEATISRYESGAVDNIPLNRIRTLASLYGINPAWILGMSEKKFIYGKE